MKSHCVFEPYRIFPIGWQFNGCSFGYISHFCNNVYLFKTLGCLISDFFCFNTRQHKKLNWIYNILDLVSATENYFDLQWLRSSKTIAVTKFPLIFVEITIFNKFAAFGDRFSIRALQKFFKGNKNGFRYQSNFIKFKKKLYCI